ncbi:PA1136 family autoinducer-binding transcriptional regulator [Salinicola sp.]|uniref:PA1136 family autoinducer-binding transcriptional regulator n=1 Tax=Salinicola sp. TaxID=1978524 RepID=UPI0025CBFCDE|nr:PA1136 family autoinducer-binding transcriptional regulator [Salinicola sp.]
MVSSTPATSAINSALAIEGAETLAKIQTEVRTFARQFGYDRFVLFSASTSSDDLIERIYWVEGDWLGDGQTVDAETYVRRCPVTRHIFEAREPFFWTKTTDVSGERYRVVRLPRGPGLNGIQVPVFGPLGLEGAMSLGGETIDASPQARLAIGLVANAAFFRARQLLEAPMNGATRSLSGREREVLTWIAAGRRQTEIAAILGLSERTVENHLRRIRQRLGVTTTAQAISIAIRRGEIVA